MECPSCGTELEHEDIFGRLFSHQDGEISGDIYRCPVAVEEEGKCDSEMFHVCGSYYMYRADGVLHEGYPC